MIDLFAEPSKIDGKFVNIAWQWVDAILPSDTSTAWGQTFAVFTAILAMFGSFYLAYTTVTGIVASAYTGKVMGERFHQIWTPLRIILGFGLIVPIGGQFSSIHYGIKYFIALPAVNAADHMWFSYVDSVAGKSVPILPTSTGGSGVVMSVLEHEICAAIYNKSGDTWGWQTRRATPAGDVSGDRVWWSYGPTCGSLSYTMLDDRPNFSEARRKAMETLVTGMRTAAAKYAEAVTENTGVNSSDAYVRAIANGSLPVAIVADLRAAGEAFDKRIAEAAKAEAATLETESRGKLVENARQQGWMSMGMYWRGLSDISMLGTRMANEKPERQMPRLDSDFGQQIAKGFEALRFQVSGEAARVDISANDFTAAGDDRADFLTKVLGPSARDIGVWFASVDPDDDPMARRIAGGQVWVSAAESGVVIGGAVMIGASNWFAEKLGAGGAATWFLDWAKLAISAMWLIGAMWAYIIPMLPTIYTYMAGCLFVVAIAEAMIAGPIWALTFMKADNEDFIGSAQRMGLRLLLNIALRPALGVLSLGAGFLFFPLAVNTLDAIWPMSFYAQTGGYVPGLSSIIVSYGVKTYVEWLVHTRGFGMIASIPDRVMAWLEIQGAGSMGEADHTAAAVMGATALGNRSTPGALPSRALSKAKPTSNMDGEGYQVDAVMLSRRGQK